MQALLELPGFALASAAILGQQTRRRSGCPSSSCLIYFKQEKAIRFNFLQVMADREGVPGAVAGGCVAAHDVRSEGPRARQ